MNQTPNPEHSIFQSDIQDLTRHINHIKENYSDDYKPHWEGFSTDYKNYNDPYAETLRKFEITEEERFIILTCLIPHTNISILDELKAITQVNLSGGYIDYSRLIPNGKSIIFLMGDAWENKVTTALSIYGRLVNLGLIYLHEINPSAPTLSKLILPSEELESVTIFNRPYHPAYSETFPAEQLTTNLEWDDMVLTYDTRNQLRQLRNWLTFGEEFQAVKTVKRKTKRGFRALFYGPSGTGKTATVALLGKEFNREVYRIDLSMMVSKYIGETEKNLKKVFDIAEHRDWILFFDEADSIFGKRTKASSSNDRYANQEVSYLLQRIENYEGIILLATNLKGNMDDAFRRRFQTMVSFPKPTDTERYELWQKIFDTEVPVSNEVDFLKLSKIDHLTGATITNILQFCVLEQLEEKAEAITLKMIEDGIKFEQSKV